MLRKTSEPKRDAVTDIWSRLHSENLLDLHSSRNIIWVIKSVKLGGAGDLAVRRRGGICVGRHEGRRALGRYRRRWDNKIKMGLEKWDVVMYWIYLARDRDKWWAI